MVIDTNTWTIKKEIQGIGPDMQTLAVTYDGKYVIGVFSGFQRLESGIAFIDAETDELLELDTRHPRVRALFANAAREREQRLAGWLRRANVDRLEIRTDQSYAMSLQRFFRMRERRR